MESHTLRVLEFERIREALCEYLPSGLGRGYAETLTPAVDSAIVRARLDETTECRKLLDTGERLAFGGLSDCRAQVRSAAAGGLLLAEELLEVADSAEALRRLREGIDLRAERMPLLARVAVEVRSFPEMVAEIRRCLGERGEVLDRASEELARIRGGIRTARARLVGRLESVLRNAAYRQMIQDAVMVQRGGRSCIPVKAEYRTQFPGFVLDQSASGQTVFMEPTEALESANEVRSLELDEASEINRILQALSGAVGAVAGGLQESLKRAAIIDFIRARALYSEAIQATAPFISMTGEIVLKQARHPLIPGDVTPLDLEMDENRRTVIITGPNTGGKTVALKTAGLLALMAQAGLHIPADRGSRLPVFPAIFADIGDEQSIEQSLSTFSSHLRQIVTTVGNLKEGSLVLLDELGAGTDPEEGAALAVTLLEYFTSRNARTIVTSHFGELKEFAYRTPGVENASVQFDEETLQPTFRLQMGVPGRSLALIIAARLGLSEELVGRARGRVRHEEQSAAEMIRQLEVDQREAGEARMRAEEDAREASYLKEKRIRELADLDRRRRQILDKAAIDAQQVVREAREQVKEILSELRERSEKRSGQAGLSGTHVATETLSAMDADLTEVRRQIAEIEPKKSVRPLAVSPGMSVYVERFKQRGTVLSVEPGGEVMVAVGSLKMKLAADELAPAEAPPPPPQRDPNHALKMQKADAVPAELKLIGLRSEEAVQELDKYLDDALLSGVANVRIIHGKGTGALKAAVWESFAIILLWNRTGWVEMEREEQGQP